MKTVIALSTLVALLVVLACSSGDLSIDAVTPDHASTRGGDVVTVTGHGFGSHPVVRFASVAGTVTNATDDSLTVATPANLEGVVDVEVDANGSVAKLDHAITFARYDMTFVDTSYAHVSPMLVNGAGVVSADVDGDGDLDVVQAAGLEGVWIYVNDGKGDFTKVTRVAAPDPTSNVVDVVAADFDGDHSVDLFLATTGATPAALLSNDGKGTFTASKKLPALLGTSMHAIALDYDADGAIDLVVLGAPGIAVLANRPTGFVDVTAKALVGGSFATTGVAAADVNHDGDVDLVFGAAADPCRLYVNDGHGVFQHASVDALPSDVFAAGVPAFGDLDGDGFVDLYIPSSKQDHVLFNDRTGRFQDLTSLRLGPETGNGVSASIADLDQDGHADVVVVEQPGALRMYRNDGTGRLFDYSAQIAGADASLWNAGAAIADFDGDGDADVFVSRGHASRAALLSNWAPLATSDQDRDGVPDSADDCPTIADPSQSNVDSAPFMCVSSDACNAALKCDVKLFGASAYLVCAGAATWASAEAACVARGAHLVTIDDAAENAFLASSAPTGFWTGGNDNANHGTWVWTGGTSSYVDWAKSQPDDAQGVEHCIQVGADGTWNDLNCATGEPFVCETARTLAPDPGDACDPCPHHYDPSAKPLTSLPDAGADAAADAGSCK